MNKKEVIVNVFKNQNDDKRKEVFTNLYIEIINKLIKINK